MTILITGASGFIGSHLFDYLQSKHTVLGISEDSNKANYINCNLLDIKTCIKALQDSKLKEVDVVIHLASILANSDNLLDIDVLNKNNVLTNNIFILGENFGTKKIINFSSSSVYPNIDGEFNEDSEINPALNADSIYGLSKFNSEIIINTLSKKSQLIISHLRCAMVYGKGVNSTRIWPVMEKELNEKNTITVFGDGKRLINQIEIGSVLKTIDKFITNNLPGVYNVCEETISLENLAKRIIKEGGNEKSKIIYVESGNRAQFVINANKLKALN
jgi:nucleoside-diphosphate-sugar epimerase